jgi:YfiH family protein
MSGWPEEAGGPRWTLPRYSAVGGRTVLTYPDLAFPGLAHGIAVFRDLRVGIAHELWTEAVRSALAADSRIAGMPLALLRQVHGTRIEAIRDGSESDSGASAGAGPDREADGLVSDLRGTAVAVSVADCLPLLAFDQEPAVVGVAHCGWRGVAGGIAESLVESLRGLGFGRGGRFLVGAGIGVCCYEVREDLLKEFASGEVERFAVASGSGTRFDLKRAVAGRLEACGVSPGSISIDATCTSCNKDLLSSYRADGAACGRMVAFIGLTPRPGGEVTS